MNMTPDDLDLLAAEYVLGTTEGQDRQLAEELLASSPTFREAVTRWQSKFSALDETAPRVTPSPGLWEAIASHVAMAPAEEAAAPARRRIAQKKPSFLSAWWESLSFWRYGGMLAAAASLVLAVALAAVIQRPSPSPVYVAVLNTGDGRAAAVVNAFADGSVELIPLDRIDVPNGRIIEVWTLQTREQGPVSIGRMDQARRLKLHLRDLQRPDANHLFELTLEPPGGSPTGKPTGPVLMKGLTARAI